MMQVILSSDVHGEEHFEYDTISEALEAIERLYRQATKAYIEDGTPRFVGFKVGEEEQEEENDA